MKVCSVRRIAQEPGGKRPGGSSSEEGSPWDYSDSSVGWEVITPSSYRECASYSLPTIEEVRSMMTAQEQTCRTMSNALALLEDVVESLDGAQKEHLLQIITQLEAIERTLS